MGSHFLTVSDLNKEDLLACLDIGYQLKGQLQTGNTHHYLTDKTLVMVFEKPSVRTRLSFDIGMTQLGGRAVYLAGQDIQMGTRESVSDVSNVVSRMADVVMLRVFSHDTLDEFASVSRVPVINGLSDTDHPCQALADVLTIYERFDRFEDLKVTYVGDGNNVCRSLVQLCSTLGMEVVVSCPDGYAPTGIDSSRFTLNSDPMDACKGAHVVYTDVWTSMGQENEAGDRLAKFRDYTVTTSMMSEADSSAVFMHCLPVHRGEEVEDAVVDGPQSVVFEQAENRLHAQKGLLVHLLVEL